LQEVEGMVLPQQKKKRDKFSRKEAVMQVPFQEKFPGIECIFDYLPHIGRLFEHSFGLLYDRVTFRPYFSRDAVFQEKVSLHIERKYGRKVFGNNIVGLEFDLPGAGISCDDFMVDGVSVSTFSEIVPEIADKLTNWLRNRISEEIGKYEFRLRLSEKSRASLAGKCYAIPVFVLPDVNMRLKPLTFRIKALSECSVVKFPGGDEYFSANWSDIIPDIAGDVNDHHRYISVIADWYCRWISAKNLIAMGKDIVNLQKLWKEYQADLSYWNNLLNMQ